MHATYFLLHFAQCLTNLKSFVLVEGILASVVPLALALRSHLKDTNAPTGQQNCLLTCELHSLFAHVPNVAYLLFKVLRLLRVLATHNKKLITFLKILLR